MKDLFVKRFKENLLKLGCQQKKLALVLGMTEAEFSKKVQKPFRGFTESEIRIIRYYTGARISELVKMEDPDAAWIFSPDIMIKDSFEAMNDRLTKIENLLCVKEEQCKID